jgi:hypothetical protein
LGLILIVHLLLLKFFRLKNENKTGLDGIMRKSV